MVACSAATIASGPSPPRQAADRVTGESERPQPLGTLPPKFRIEAALHEPEECLIRSRVRRPAPLGPAERPPHRVFHHRPLGRQRHDMIHLHGDIGADPLLNPHRVLGRELDRAAVDVGAKKGAGLGDPHLLCETEHLEAARIGERGTIPSHERRHAPRLLDQLLAGPQVEVIRIGEHHPGAGLANAADIDSLHAGERGHRHEQGRGHAAVRRRQRSRPRRPVRGRDLECESGLHCGVRIEGIGSGDAGAHSERAVKCSEPAALASSMPQR